MNKLLLLTSLTLLVAPFARGKGLPTENSSWDVILDSDRVEVDMPVLEMSDGPVTTVDQLCSLGHILRTKKKFTKYLPIEKKPWDREDPNDGHPVGRKKVKDYGYVNLIQKYEVCREWEDRGDEGHYRCADPVEIEYKVPSIFKDIPVYKIRNLGRDNERRGYKLFEKDLIIPDCE
jgi:hypothetical protein